MSSNGGISGSMSVVAVGSGWGSSCPDMVFSLDVSASLVFSTLVCFLPGLYSHPVILVKNFFHLTWKRSAISV